jgi:hypothetical protein
MPDGRLQIVHHCEGRLRVKAEAIRASHALAQRVVARLAREPGVVDVRVSTATGSVVIQYESRDLQLLQLIERILSLGDFTGLAVDAPIAGLPRTTPGDRFRDRLGAWNEWLRLRTSGQLDLASAVPGGLAGAGLLFALLRRPRLPEWYDLVFWSFVTFVNLNPARQRDDPRP